MAKDEAMEAADRNSRNAALTLSLTLPSDAVLYLLLPLYASSFGVSLPEAGVLLAANRLVRIAGYSWVARFYSERGPRAASIAAVAGASIAVIGNATLSGVWALLVVRLIWGLSFAAMNIATQALPTAMAEGAALRSGRARSIIAGGPMIGLVFAALATDTIGPRGVFVVLSVVTPLAFLFAARLPSEPAVATMAGPRFSWPGMFNIWAFAMGFALDGVFIFGLSLLAAQHFSTAAVLAAGALMALRYVSEIVFAPVGGQLAHRFGALKTLIAASLAAALAFAMLGTSGVLLWIALIAMVVLRGLLQPLPAPVVAHAYPGAGLVPALAKQATWRDIGAGAGPLVAGLVFPVLPAAAIYAATGLMFALITAALLNRRWAH